MCLEMRHEIGSSTPAAQRTPNNKPYVDTLRTMLRAIYTSTASSAVEEFYGTDEQKRHNCSGPRFESIHDQDPSPIWIIS